LLILTFGGLTFLFLVLAVPIQFKQQWVTMAWAIEGAVMTWVGLRAKDKTSLYASLCLFGIAAFHWFMIDVPAFGYVKDSTFTPLLNPRAYSGFVLIAALAVSAWLYKKFASHLSDEERSMFNGIYLLGANAFAITLLSLDVRSYFEQKRASTALSNDLSQIRNTYFFTLTALWAMYGAVMLFIGVIRRLTIVRLAALLLLAGTVLKVLVADLWYYNEPWHLTIFNQTFGSFFFVITALALSAWWYLRSTDISEEERSFVIPLLIGTANLLALIALSAEVIGHFNRVEELALAAKTMADEKIEDTKQFALTAVWTVYGAVALFIGIKRKVRAIRFASIGLLAITAVRILLVNLQYVSGRWHTTIFNQTFAAFALLIFALACGIWWYSHDKNIEDSE